MLDTVKSWIFGIALKKGITKGVQALIALLAAKGVPATAAMLGVQIDMAKFEIELTAAIFAGLEISRNWLKVKYGVKWI